MKVFLCFYLFLSFGQSSYSQSLVDDVKAPLEQEAAEANGTFTETIKIISASKKIFVLSNNNQMLGPGDFISIALNNKLAARALVAKTYDGNAGIKIMKIYSMAQWTQLKRTMEVQIIRGDDSMFGKKPEETKKEETKIKTEDDLYDDKNLLEDDLTEIRDNNNRNIKPDNVVSVGVGFFSAKDANSGTARSQELSAAWSYQFNDNFFIEGLYARSVLSDYPGNQAQTLVNKFSGRLKYCLKAPLYSYVLPYIGFYTQTVSSPDAGVGQTPSQAATETNLVNDLKKNGIAIGVTVLRRLVPGWFVKADLGTDVINIGAAIEF